MTTYKCQNGHTFTASAAQPVEVFTTSDIEALDIGQIVTDNAGNTYAIAAIAIYGRHSKITLIPQDHHNINFDIK